PIKSRVSAPDLYQVHWILKSAKKLLLWATRQQWNVHVKWLQKKVFLKASPPVPQTTHPFRWRRNCAKARTSSRFCHPIVSDISPHSFSILKIKNHWWSDTISRAGYGILFWRSPLYFSPGTCYNVSIIME